MGDKTWIYIVAAVAVLGIIIYKLVTGKKRKTQKLRARVMSHYGQMPDREYTEEELDKIKAYYEAVRDENAYYVDDITWNDLDLDRLFISLNHTYSSVGEEVLYDLLREPSFDAEELKERNRLIELFRENEDLRYRLLVDYARIGRTKKYSLVKFVSSFKDLRLFPDLKHWMHIILLVMSVVITFIDPLIGIMAIIVTLGYNIYTYFKEKTFFEPYYVSLSAISYLVEAGEQIVKYKEPELEKYRELLKEEIKPLVSIKKDMKWIGNAQTVGSSGDMGQIFGDYIRMMTHIDFVKFNHMVKRILNHETEIYHLMRTLGYLDAMLSIASYREMLPFFCVGEFTDIRSANHEGTETVLKPEEIEKSENVEKTESAEKTEKFEKTESAEKTEKSENAEKTDLSLKVKDAYHPLLSRPVANSIDTDKSVLLTGSNASGKSTFLRTIAVSSLFAQTIATVPAHEYRGPFYRIYSSMALHDNMEANESYYMVEIRSMKRIMDQVAEQYPVLGFVDEVLRGTNTVERIAASTQILKSFAGRNAMIFAATHDIELTHLLEKDYNNYHFEEEIVEGEIRFNYALQKGRSVTRNAIKLLEVMGYDPKVTENAEKSAEHFIKTGNWEI